MKKAIRTILLIVCICVFCYSAYNLINIYLNYKKIDDDYGELANTYTSVKDEKKEEQNYLQIDWATLKERNNDVKAWIQIPDTNVNYPVLQGETNDTYIHSDIDHQKLSAGSIFVDCRNEKPFEDFNTVIYGHNMKNGSMFNNIKSYTDQSFADEHPYVYIYLPDGSINVYSIYSTKIIDATSDYYLKDIDYASYVANAKSSAKQSRDVDTQNTAPLLLLSTCYAHDTPSRSVLFARLEKNVK